MSLMDRIESLERRTVGFGLPDHVITYQVDVGENDEEKKTEALARYTAERTIEPADHVLYNATHIIAPKHDH